MQSQDKYAHRYGGPVEPPPRVVIYAENEPTGEDLEACLEGPFRVEVTTGLGAAVAALSDPAAVLLVVPTEDPEPMIDWSALLHRALIRDCRVVVLGSTGTALEEGFRDSVLAFPNMLDPARLHRELTSLIA